MSVNLVSYNAKSILKIAQSIHQYLKVYHLATLSAPPEMHLGLIDGLFVRGAFCLRQFLTLLSRCFSHVTRHTSLSCWNTFILSPNSLYLYLALSFSRSLFLLLSFYLPSRASSPSLSLSPNGKVNSNSVLAWLQTKYAFVCLCSDPESRIQPETKINKPAAAAESNV